MKKIRKGGLKGHRFDYECCRIYNQSRFETGYKEKKYYLTECNIFLV